MKHDYYGIPLWLMKEYLTDLGAVEETENVMVADNWRAVVSRAKAKQLGSLAIGGTSVEFSGDEKALTNMFVKLHRKTLRGGA